MELNGLLFYLLERLVDKNNLDSLDRIFAVIFIVLNLDSLDPQFPPNTSRDSKWHNEPDFEHDWPIGVHAALKCLANIVETIPGASEILEAFENWVVDDLAEGYAPKIRTEESVEPIEIRCVCGNEEHRDRRSVTEDWKPKVGTSWPDYIFNNRSKEKK
jgi:hypothetical protein